MSKMVDVEIDMPDDVFMHIAQKAHQRDITFNEMVQDILQHEIDNEVFRRIVERHMKDMGLE